MPREKKVPGELYFQKLRLIANNTTIEIDLNHWSTGSRSNGDGYFSRLLGLRSSATWRENISLVWLFLLYVFAS